jgi:hypothetical protein
MSTGPTLTNFRLNLIEDFGCGDVEQHILHQTTVRPQINLKKKCPSQRKPRYVLSARSPDIVLPLTPRPRRSSANTAKRMQQEPAPQSRRTASQLKLRSPLLSYVVERSCADPQPRQVLLLENTANRGDGGRE